jgi:hypothetical protein
MQLQSGVAAATIECVENDSLRARTVANSRSPFAAGAIVVLTLSNPRDKIWGMILTLAPEGLSLCGIELASFEDLVVMVKDGEPFTPAVVFFPMHRIERVDVDLPDGNLPSLSQRFATKTGYDPATILASAGAQQGTNLHNTGPTGSRSGDEEPA